jgi:hypothetical protein
LHHPSQRSLRCCPSQLTICSAPLRDDPSKNRTVFLDSSFEPRHNSLDAVKLLLILSLRISSVAAKSVDELISSTLAGGKIGVVEWLHPNRPLHPAFVMSSTTQLDLDQAASYYQLRDTLEKASALVGVEDGLRLRLHDIRRGAARDASDIKSANTRGLVGAQDLLGHTNVAAQKGLTAQYAGASRDSTWAARADLPEDVWNPLASTPLTINVARPTRRLHSQPVHVPQGAEKPPAKTRKANPPLNGASVARRPAAKEKRKASVVNAVSLGLLQSTPEHPQSFAAEATTELAKDSATGFTAQERLELETAYPWLTDENNESASTSFDLFHRGDDDDDDTDNSLLQDLSTIEFDTWTAAANAPILHNGDSVGSKYPWLQTLIEAPSNDASTQRPRLEQLSPKVRLEYPWLQTLLETPPDISNTDEPVTRSSLVPSITDDVSEDSFLQELSTIEFDTWTASANALTLPNGDSVPSVPAVTVVANAAAKLILPPLEFMEFFCKINITVVQATSKKQEKKLVPLMGGSKDPPALFVYQCMKTAGCDFQHTRKSRMEEHEVSCTVEPLLQPQSLLEEWKCTESQCGASGRSQDPHASLAHHKRLQHSWKPKRCNVTSCTDETLFADRKAWRKHEQVHTGQLSCPVSECKTPDQIFSLSSSLRRHLTVQHQIPKGAPLDALVNAAKEIKKTRELKEPDESTDG